MATSFAGLFLFIFKFPHIINVSKLIYQLGVLRHVEPRDQNLRSVSKLLTPVATESLWSNSPVVV